jgi:hypothetical protein
VGDAVVELAGYALAFCGFGADGGLQGAQPLALLLGPLAREDVVEDDGDSVLAGLAYAEGVDVVEPSESPFGLANSAPATPVESPLARPRLLSF